MMKSGGKMSAKKQMRLENKKRKLAALYDITKSNDASLKKMKEDDNCINKEEKVVGGGGVCSDQQYRTMKQFLNKRKRRPGIRLKGTGHYAMLTTDADKRIPIFLSDVRNMLQRGITAATDEHIDGSIRWIAFNHLTQIKQVLTVVVEGVSVADLQAASAPQLHQTDPQPEPLHDKKIKLELQDGESASISIKQEPAETKVEPKVENTESNEIKQEPDNTNSEPQDNDVKPRKIGNAEQSAPEWLVESLPRTSGQLQYKLELLAPSQYSQPPCQELLNVPLTKAATAKMIKKYGNIRLAAKDGLVYRALASLYPLADPSVQSLVKDVAFKAQTRSVADKFDRRSLVLGPADMVAHGFPAPLPNCPGFGDETFVNSHEQYTELKPNSPMFAVDCEMCMTTLRKLELTSISVVNEDLKLVYHTLVQPPRRIINYLTEFSGITPRMLRGVTTTLQDVQRHLRELLPRDAILVGHSLNSDLVAMKMRHPYVIDSSLVYNLTGVRKQRSKLKLLMKMFLEKDIQNHGALGHDPSEDAAASLELIKLKLKHDMVFGDVIRGAKIQQNMAEALKDSDELEHEYKLDEAFQPTGDLPSYANSIFQLSKGRSTALVTTPGGMTHYQAVFQQASWCPHLEVLPGNKQVSQMVASMAPHHQVIYAHMPMASSLERCTTTEERKSCLDKLDKRLSRVVSSAAPDTLVTLVFTGSPLTAPAPANGLVMLDVKRG